MAKQEVQWFESWFNTKYYHVLYKNRDFSEAEHFIVNLLGYLHLPSSSKCLDLACGMGRHAVFLNKQGFDVTGLDLSVNSIQKAKIFENNTLHFDVHDMRKAYASNAFDIVFNLFTSFGYFDEIDDSINTLKAIHKMLKPGGNVVIDFLNVDYAIDHLKPKEVILKSGIEFHISKAFDGKTIQKNIQFNHKGRFYSFEEKVQAISLSSFEKMLSDVQLDLVDVFGDYSLQPYNNKNSERLILIAKKK